MFDQAVDIFVQILQYALPIGIAFEMGNLVVSTILRAAFGGRLWFGR